MSYKIPIFLSYSQPFTIKQQEFIEHLRVSLDEKGFIGRTLGVTDYDMNEPLTAIRRLILECNGMITVAFKRHHIELGKSKPNSNLSGVQTLDISNKWLTSPYCHIEPAMAFQIGIPILILREKDVIAEGILEKGVAGVYLPEIDIDIDNYAYFSKIEWKQIFGKWEGNVRQVVENKGKPPRLY